ncbi:MAG TPA: SDR family NAD(P)-dependent oxidoreductase, partial [Chloroflexota bacterium]|nr:SDR family NAD(P)-dependent oxidoreductase [Chloroflexota bacterium]
MRGEAEAGGATMRFLAGFGVGLAASAAVQGSPSTDLRGQVVLITGGSPGLGLLLAREFGREGCRLALCARDQDELARAEAALAPLGVEV